MKDDQIKALLGFEESDLLANREGRFSEEQNKRIREVDRFALRFVFILFLISLASGIFVGVLALNARNNIWLWIGMIVLLLLAAWLFRALRTKVDDAVQKVQGEVNFVKAETAPAPGAESSDHKTRSSYKMQVGTEVFSNIDPALIEYMEGDTYAVYYTKTTKYILSVEKITSET
jgi:hypothetical protein